MDTGNYKWSTSGVKNGLQEAVDELYEMYKAGDNYLQATTLSSGNVITYKPLSTSADPINSSYTIIHAAENDTRELSEKVEKMQNQIEDLESRIEILTQLINNFGTCIDDISVKLFDLVEK